MINTTKGARMARPATTKTEPPAQQIARLKDNLQHISAQLVERTATVVEQREEIAALREEVSELLTPIEPLPTTERDWEPSPPWDFTIPFILGGIAGLLIASLFAGA